MPNERVYEPRLNDENWYESSRVNRSRAIFVALIIKKNKALSPPPSHALYAQREKDGAIVSRDKT